MKKMLKIRKKAKIRREPRTKKKRKEVSLSCKMSRRKDSTCTLRRAGRR